MLYLVGLIAYIAATAIAGIWLVLPWYGARLSVGRGRRRAVSG